MSDDAEPADAPTPEPERVHYDEFALFHENIAEYDLDVDPDRIGPIERFSIELPHAPGRRVSGLRWGDAAPEVVFVHGGAQNAHTWDTVALALGAPAVAIDLPGHGHSDWRSDKAYSPDRLAEDLAPVVEALAPDARLLVGMSLGGLTSLALTDRRPDLVAHLVLVDITPGVNARKAKAVIDFVDGPQTFPRFDDLLARTMEHNPTRSASSLRRGILHNARQRDDGSWQWRYDRSGHTRGADDGTTDDRVDPVDPGAAAAGSAGDAPSPLWDALGATTCPVTLVRGSLSPVVDDDDVAEARRRRPDIDVHVIDGAGHSIQGDRPVELAALLASLSATRP